MKLLLYLIFSFSLLTAQNNCEYNNRSVFFGQRKKELKEAPANVFRVFYDKNGYLYPEIEINDNELENNCSSLEKWLEKNEQTLNNLCAEYKIPNDQLISEKISILNDSLVKKAISQINEKAKDYEIIDVVIHGFRKRAYGDIDMSATYSVDDNEEYRTEIKNRTSKKIFTIEVYWDSKFITPIQSYRFKGFKLFEEAGIPNAQNVGLALRKIVSELKQQNINVIGHSLGTQVAVETLFNANANILQKESINKTPDQQNIKLCLIAPAMGHEAFKNFYVRNTTFDYKTKDNYRVCVVYNQNDFVLKKQYGFGVNALPTEYGNTSLGCNYDKDIQKLENLFKSNFKNSPIPLLLDLSESERSGPMNCHMMYCYFSHKKFDEAIHLLYD